MSRAAVAASEAGQKLPKPGDLTFCCQCAAPLKVDELLELVELTEEEQTRLEQACPPWASARSMARVFAHLLSTGPLKGASR